MENRIKKEIEKRLEYWENGLKIKGLSNDNKNYAKKCIKHLKKELTNY